MVSLSENSFDDTGTPAMSVKEDVFEVSVTFDLFKGKGGGGGVSVIDDLFKAAFGTSKGGGASASCEFGDEVMASERGSVEIGMSDVFLLANTAPLFPLSAISFFNGSVLMLVPRLGSLVEEGCLFVVVGGVVSVLVVSEVFVVSSVSSESCVV